MAAIQQVRVDPLKPERFEEILTEEGYGAFAEGFERARSMLEGRKVINVNSTARGGGVAEMLSPLLAYARGAGVDARWMVITGDPGFFEITKRIHNNLHGAPGDGGPLGDDERRVYEATLARNADELTRLVGSSDIVLLHDPQTAGLVEPLKATGAAVVWRCHLGLDTPNEIARGAWDFLRPYVEPADRYVFSRRAFAWEKLDDDKIIVIAPSIDAFSPKNQDLDATAVQAILSVAGLTTGNGGPSATYRRVDGSSAVVERRADLNGGGPFGPDDPLVVQVSRWDRLKDPLGVMKGFADHVAPATSAHLVLAGPSVAAVSDDPEGAMVLAEAESAWNELPADVRDRIHLACLPMEDGDENAAIVNALQRRADVVVQKSIAEGFGLTVAEGMWKARPVVASRIGGIQDQISHRETGMLIDDPHDLAAFGDAVTALLQDPGLAEAIGSAARTKVRDSFLGPRHLLQYVDLVGDLIAAR